jgi:hypothetical protein
MQKSTHENMHLSPAKKMTPSKIQKAPKSRTCGLGVQLPTLQLPTLQLDLSALMQAFAPNHFGVDSEAAVEAVTPRQATPAALEEAPPVVERRRDTVVEAEAAARAAKAKVSAEKMKAAAAAWAAAELEEEVAAWSRQQVEEEVSSWAGARVEAIEQRWLQHILNQQDAHAAEEAAAVSATAAEGGGVDSLAASWLLALPAFRAIAFV